jgi:hypothetical protein
VPTVFPSPLDFFPSNRASTLNAPQPSLNQRMTSRRSTRPMLCEGL